MLSSRLARPSVLRSNAFTSFVRRALPLCARSLSGDSKAQCPSTPAQGTHRAKLLNGEALVEAAQALALMKVGGSNVRFLDATWHLDKARNGNQEYITEVKSMIDEATYF